MARPRETKKTTSQSSLCPEPESAARMYPTPCRLELDPYSEYRFSSDGDTDSLLYLVYILYLPKILPLWDGMPTQKESILFYFLNAR